MATRKGTKNRTTPPRQTTPETAADAKRHFIRPQVMEIIRQGNGNPVTLSDIATALKCPARSVQHAASKLVHTVPQVQVVLTGQAWRWSEKFIEPEPEPETELLVDVEAESETVYRKVGQNAAGEAILRKDGDPQLYTAQPL